MVHRNHAGLVLTLLLWLPIGTNAVPQSAESQFANNTQRAAAGCPVTIPRKAPAEAESMFGSGAAHWNGKLFVGALWPEGTIVFKPGGSGFIYPDGSMGMKIAWYRAEGLRGKLNIYGRRLDGAAPPLRARLGVPNNLTGFNSSEVIFPTEGCWEVTGEVASASVTFVTRVVRVK